MYNMFPGMKGSDYWERQKPVARNPSFIVMNVLECTLTTCTCLDLRSEIVKDLEILGRIPYLKSL